MLMASVVELRLRFQLPAPVPATSFGSGYQLRLPAPNNNIFVTQIKVKSAVLKTMANNFFHSSIPIFSFNLYKL